MEPITKIAVFCSGGGTGLQALLDAEQAGRFPTGQISLVLSNSSSAYALERAKASGVATAVSRKSDYSAEEEREDAVIDLLEKYSINLVVLAGYLGIIGKKVLSKYPRRIINIHPSLLPSFGGKGFYGLKVHQAALDYGVKVTGATVHFVSEVVDGGEILLQKAVEVQLDDTPLTLQRRVMEEAEWILLPKAVAIICEEDAKAKKQEEDHG